MIRVGLVGITGYAGLELVRLLATHPEFQLTMACSRAEEGRKLGEYFPLVAKLPLGELVITNHDVKLAAKECDLVFLAVPAGTAARMVPELITHGLKVVDFSADFRLKDYTVYEKWYKEPHKAKEYLAEAVYGLPELYSEQIKRTRLLANPGCYPTSILLALYAAFKHKLIAPQGIIIDSKSGTSGAGRKAALPSLFCEVNDSFRAYGLVNHRHTPEIEQELTIMSGETLTVQFTPHLVPMNRGILSTIYANLTSELSQESVQEAFAETWEQAPWVRVLPKDKLPETRFVRGSMYCDLALRIDPRTKRLIIVSVIDNLCRGAAGQALANANLMCQLPLDLGLNHQVPMF
ncbi:MAG: N-acetyl-gamma-glutamyl-phosphate reductase [Desulfovibrio sp.]|nr:N-acetyl-gamma-glutamyl-phosphate reductase [Desulfovibrio sp.]